METPTEDSLIPRDDHEIDERIAPTLAALTEQQEAEAQQYAIEFIKKVILRGVKIEREDYLRQEFRKLGLSDGELDDLVASSPLQAGIPLADLDRLATDTIGFETKKSAAMSFAAGIPGGFVMVAAVPADITQYYVHAFRIMQKLAYIYGWQDFLGDIEQADDETVGKLAVFLGVMLGVGGASASFTKFAQQVARPAIQKQIANKALTKTAWYPVIKQTLKLVGIKVTKDSFAKTITKVVPVAGGLISGGMTLVSLNSQAVRLHTHLRELTPPGVDAAEYASLLKAAAFDGETESLGVQAKAAVSQAVSGVADGAKSFAGSTAENASAAAVGAGNLLKGFVGSWREGRRAKGNAEADGE